MPLDPIVKDFHAKRFGMPADVLHLIGYGTLLWNSVEIELQVLTRLIGRLPKRKSEFITVDMQNVSRGQLARNFLRADPIEPAVDMHIMTALALFDELRGIRNAIIHGVPVIKHGRSSNTPLVVRWEAKEGAGKLKVRETRLTERYVLTFIQTTELLSTSLRHLCAVVALARQYNGSRKIRASNTFQDFVWQGAGRGPEEYDLKSAQVSLARLQNPIARRKSR